jgi:hypothetical protein
MAIPAGGGNEGGATVQSRRNQVEAGCGDAGSRKSILGQKIQKEA